MLNPPFFSSVHNLGFTFCSINGKERAGSIFMKTEAWSLVSISLPKRDEGDWHYQNLMRKNSTESQLQLKE